MRKIRITITTVWYVQEYDDGNANIHLKNQPKDIACAYMEDGWGGVRDIDTPTVKWEEIK